MVIVMDTGIAKLCSISEHMTTVLTSVEVPIPKKRPGATGTSVRKSTPGWLMIQCTQCCSVLIDVLVVCRRRWIASFKAFTTSVQ